MNLTTAISQFLTRLEAEGKSPNTISCYRRDLRSLTTFAGDIPSADITEDLLARYLLSDAVTKTHTGAPRSHASIGRIKACLKSFGRFTASVGATERDPAAWIKVKRHQREAPSYLTPQEVKVLLKAVASRKGATAQRDLIMLKLFLGTGIRLAELVGLDIADVRLDDKKLRLQRVKGGHSQERFLNTDLRRALRKYIRGRKKVPADTDALFLSNRNTRISTRQVQERMKLWLAWAGLDGSTPLTTGHKITVHSLRHTHATMLYARTHNLLLVSKALGHAQVSTTQIYAHIADDELEEALEGL